MASSAENRAVNLAGLVQGITLVTFPAASSIFTDPSEYDLSGAQYGAMFVPQVLTAIATSTTQSALALTAFWAMVTVGRLLFAAIVRWPPARAVFHLRQPSPQPANSPG
jgi:hypothetical protein